MMFKFDKREYCKLLPKECLFRGCLQVRRGIKLHENAFFVNANTLEIDNL